MTIRREIALEFIKKSRLRYGFDEENSYRDFRVVELYSDDLPVSTTEECKLAADIAKKYNLKFLLQDFGPGEGVYPEFKPVFAVCCYSETELEEVLEKFKKATAELENNLRKLYA